MTLPNNPRKAPPMAEVNDVVAEWTAAMEGVTPGEWASLHHAPDDYYTFGHGFEARQVDTAPADKYHWPVRICTSPGGVSQPQPSRDADWIARCSPSGIRSLLDLLAQQAAREEALTKARDHWLGETRRILTAGQDAVDRLTAAEAENARLREALDWIARFAAIRSKDDRMTAVKVHPGALRNIAERARAALSTAAEKEG